MEAQEHQVVKHFCLEQAQQFHQQSQLEQDIHLMVGIRQVVEEAKYKHRQRWIAQVGKQSMPIGQ